MLKVCKGCNKQKPLTLEFLLNHLQETFEFNYGIGREYINWEEVHIDHIIPLSTVTSELEIIKLNHYSNLRLLFWEDNIEKSNKLDYKIP